MCVYDDIDVCVSTYEAEVYIIYTHLILCV